MLLRILILFCTIYIHTYAQPLTIQWKKCYGGTTYDEGQVIKNYNGGFIGGCNVTSNDGDVFSNHGFNDYWLINIDDTGTLQSQKCFGGTSEDRLSSIILEEDASFTIAGTSSSNDGDVSASHLPSDIWIMNCDNLGSIQWQKCYGGSDEDAAKNMIKCFDNGYILIGYSRSNDFDVIGHHDSTLCPGCKDAWLVKIDSTGTIQWSRCYGGTWPEEGFSIIQTEDSGYVFAASAMSADGDVQGLNGVIAGGAPEDFWIVKIDASGNILWQDCFGGSESDIPKSIIRTNDKGYMVIGTTTSNDSDVTGFHGSNVSDAWIIKLDSVGNLQWQKCLGGTNTDVGYKILQLADSSYFVMCMGSSTDGDLSANPALGSDVWFIKLSNLGGIEWQQLLGGSSDDFGLDILQSPDSGFVFSGVTYSNNGDVTGNHGYADVWVVKLSPLQNRVSDVSSLKEFSTTFNSTTNELQLNFYANAKENLKVQLIDITGRILFQQNVKANPGFNEKKVHIDQHSEEMYFLRLESVTGSTTKKVFLN